MIRGSRIGYISTVLPFGDKGIERFALYLLLLKLVGPKSFEEVRTVEGIIYETFKEAAIAWALIDHDNEIEYILNEAFIRLLGKPLRRFFAILLYYWKPKNTKELWEKFKDKFCEDFVRYEKKKLNPKINMQEMYDKALYSISFYLSEINSNLQSVGLPLPVGPDTEFETTDIFYEVGDLTEEQINENYTSLNDCQKKTADEIIDSVTNKKNGFYFIDAPGGTGKTYMLNRIIEKLSFHGKKVCATASSGITAILLKGGGTLHSKLKVPFDLDKKKEPLDITRQSKRGQEILNMDLLIWDEAPMFSKDVLECIDKSFRDLRKDDRIFGGVTVVLSGDWRQILPVVHSGGNLRAATVQACHKKSELWHQVEILRLTENMRVKSGNPDSEWFKNWLLKVGEGKENFIDNNSISPELLIPERFILPSNQINDLINVIFPDISENIGERNYLDWISERGIIAGQNKVVSQINEICLGKLPGQEVTFASMDINELSPQEKDNALPIPTLNKYEEGGLPPHILKLKIGAPVILLRNMNPSEGHCNGTRYVVSDIHPRIIDLKIANGPRKGEIFPLMRVKLFNSNNKKYMKFSRKQFPIKLSFAFTANKAQGQSFNYVGVCLAMSDFFAHGQFYVSVSRATRPENLHILLRPDSRNIAQNVVYDEILD